MLNIKDSLTLKYLCIIVLTVLYACSVEVKNQFRLEATILNLEMVDFLLNGILIRRLRGLVGTAGTSGSWRKM